MPKKIARTTVNVLTFIYILFILPFALTGIIGIRTYAVTSGSMEPDIPTASLVFVKNTSFENLKKGDVITFLIADNQTATHRIISVDKKEKKFTTKGDANEQADNKSVSYENVVGKVIFHIPYLGYLMAVSCNKGKIVLIAGIGLLLFALNLLFEDTEAKDPKKQVKKATADTAQ